jgi:hypothetical protein
MSISLEQIKNYEKRLAKECEERDILVALRTKQKEEREEESIIRMRKHLKEVAGFEDYK